MLKKHLVWWLPPSSIHPIYYLVPEEPPPTLTLCAICCLVSILAVLILSTWLWPSTTIQQLAVLPLMKAFLARFSANPTSMLEWALLRLAFDRRCTLLAINAVLFKKIKTEPIRSRSISRRIPERILIR